MHTTPNIFLSPEDDEQVPGVNPVIEEATGYTRWQLRQALDFSFYTAEHRRAIAQERGLAEDATRADIIKYDELQARIALAKKYGLPETATWADIKEQQIKPNQTHTGKGNTVTSSQNLKKIPESVE